MKHTNKQLKSPVVLLPRNNYVNIGVTFLPAQIPSSLKGSERTPASPRGRGAESQGVSRCKGP